MRRIAARAAAGVVKVLLAAVALAAAVAWPWSYRQPEPIDAVRETASPDRVHIVSLQVAARDGRIGVGMARGDHTADAWVREHAARVGPGWRLEPNPVYWGWTLEAWGSGWGPVRWAAVDDPDNPWRPRYRSASAPCWLVALAAGAWPLASVTLLVRRRAARRRRDREGRCRSCGYDLRATPAPTPAGPRLPHCPECGADALVARASCP